MADATFYYTGTTKNKSPDNQKIWCSYPTDYHKFWRPSCKTQAQPCTDNQKLGRTTKNGNMVVRGTILFFLNSNTGNDPSRLHLHHYKASILYTASALRWVAVLKFPPPGFPPVVQWIAVLNFHLCTKFGIGYCIHFDSRCSMLHWDAVENDQYMWPSTTTEPACRQT